MTEVQKMNGSAAAHNVHEEPDEQVENGGHLSLEDSIASLLSNSERTRTISNETAMTTSNYRRAAKLFINKKFQESYKLVHDQLIDDSFALFNQGKIDEVLFINIWSLYFNLIDIFLNKSLMSLPKSDKDQLLQEFQSDEIFSDFYKLDVLVHPKLIFLLLLIKLNNEETDLVKLRSQTDLYLVNISSELNHTAFSQSKVEAFQELLEIYHIYLLPKLNEFEESEYLIKTNPLITNPDELVIKLHQTKIEMENKERRKQELAEKRAIEAQRRKEQQLRDEEETRRNKELEKSRAEAIAASSANHNSKLTKRSSSKKDTNVSKDYSSIYELLKKRLLHNKYLRTTPSSSILVLIFSLVSIIVFAKTHKIILNRRIREFLSNFWLKLANTLKMAFQVTYM